MARGFVPTPEKDFIQLKLWLPVVQKAFKRNGRQALRILCLPGRQCRFLLKLLDAGLTTPTCVTCIERDKTEALLIRGHLADHMGGDGRVPVDLVHESVYQYLSGSPNVAAARKFDVIDLDEYGALAKDDSGLLRDVGAAVHVQSQAHVKDWLLLLTTEVASVRGDGVSQNLEHAHKTMMEEYEADLGNVLPATLRTDASDTALLQRYAACAGTCVVHAAFPHFEVNLQKRPLFYRGSDEYGQPQRRALMAVFAFRMTKPPKPLEGLAPRRRIATVRDRVRVVAEVCLKCEAVLKNNEDRCETTTDLGRVVA